LSKPTKNYFSRYQIHLIYYRQICRCWSSCKRNDCNRV